MSEIVTECSRCRAKHTTLEVLAEVIVNFQDNWRHTYEAFCVCRHCGRGSILLLVESSYDAMRVIQNTPLTKITGSINELVKVKDVVSVKDFASRSAPLYLPEDINNIFNEGSKCLAIKCFNAAGTMYRLCLDMATRALLPEKDSNGLNSKIRRSLGLRLDWLFDNGQLPEDMRELSSAVKDDGNDGAHEGTLSEEDAEDLVEFTTLLLQRLYTEPEKLKLAKIRRQERRAETGL